MLTSDIFQYFTPAENFSQFIAPERKWLHTKSASQKEIRKKERETTKKVVSSNFTMRYEILRQFFYGDVTAPLSDGDKLLEITKS